MTIKFNRVMTFRSILVISVIAGAVVIGLGISHQSIDSSPSAPVVAPVNRSQRKKPAEPAQKIDGLIVLKVSGSGFDPAEIERPRGHHRISVFNRSGIRDLSLRLDRVGSGRLREVALPIEKGAWRDEVDLTPGEYVLTEANHPDWVCRITVTEK